jgi:hypothetical protein
MYVLLVKQSIKLFKVFKLYRKCLQPQASAEEVTADDRRNTAQHGWDDLMSATFLLQSDGSLNSSFFFC